MYRILPLLFSILFTLQAFGQRADVIVPNLTFKQLLLNHDTLWGASDNGVLRHPIGSNELFFYTTANSQITNNNAETIAVDSAGRYWVGSTTSLTGSGPNGLAVFDGLDWTSSSTPILPTVGTYQSYRLSCNANGDMFCSFWYEAVGRYNRTTGWQIFPDGTGGGVRTAQCTHIFFDKLNRTWIGTNQGLWRQDAANTYTEIRRISSNPNTTWFNYVYDNLILGPQQDTLLLCTQMGLMKGHINDSQLTTALSTPMLKAQFPFLDTTGNQGFIALGRDTNGVKFVAPYSGGIIAIGCGQAKYINVPHTFDIVVDKNNVKWFATVGGLYSLKDVSAEFHAPLQACTGTNVHLSDSSGYICEPIISWKWQYGDGDSGTSPNHTYSTPGEFQVRLIVANKDGVADTAFQTITVTQGATVQVVGGHSATVCNGVMIDLLARATPASPTHTFYWKKDLGGGHYAVLSVDSTLGLIGPGKFFVILNRESPCPSTDTVIVSEANDPPVTFTTQDGTNGFCPGTAALLQASLNGHPLPADYHVQWLLNGDSLAGDTAPGLAVTAPGRFSLAYTSPHGCVSMGMPLFPDSSFTMFIPMHRWPLPVATLDALNDTVLCGRDSSLLFANLGAYVNTFAWYFNGVLAVNGPRPLFYTAQQPGVYSLRLESAKGCTSSDSVMILMPPAATPVLTGPAGLCYGDTAVLQLTGAYGLPITWETDWAKPETVPHILMRSNLDTVVRITGPGSVTANILGCYTYTSNTLVVSMASEKDCPQPFYPNIITLNQDGLNDSFVITNPRPDTELKVYDRWGKLVHQSSDYKNDWRGDGRAGVYFVDVQIPGYPRYRGWVSVEL